MTDVQLQFTAVLMKIQERRENLKAEGMERKSLFCYYFLFYCTNNIKTKMVSTAHDKCLKDFARTQHTNKQLGMLIHIKYEKMRQTERVNVVSYRLKVDVQKELQQNRIWALYLYDVKTFSHAPSSGINVRQ